ncbi:Cerato-platanin-domain-containing protein [Ganoderma leucocontextum]|nr:Cerato-platanin-domain-containing protein [Ganoderma leucocontextum]
MLSATASHILLAFAATLLSVASSQARTLERMSAVATPRNVSVSYDRMYDEGETPFSAVSCSDWMAAKGYSTFAALPSFPHIAGADTVDGSNSALCGQCWQLTYDTPTEMSGHFLIIDSAKKGFTIAQRAMDDLTDGQAARLGRVDAVGTVVARSHCGMH